MTTLEATQTLATHPQSEAESCSVTEDRRVHGEFQTRFARPQQGSGTGGYKEN